MTEALSDLDKAMQEYFAEGAPGDVNQWLDAKGIVHEPVMEAKKVGEFEPRYPVCGDGLHAVMHGYYNKHDGEHIYWTCEPN